MQFPRHVFIFFVDMQVLLGVGGGPDLVMKDRVAKGRDRWLFFENYEQALCARKGVGGGI